MNMNMNVFLDTLGHKYEQEYYLQELLTTIFDDLKIIKPQVNATYQSKYCEYTPYTPNYIKYLKKNLPFLVL